MNRTETRWELFETPEVASLESTAAEPIGLLYRRWNETELVTEVIFAHPEPHRISSVITLEGKRWTTSRFVEDGTDPVIINAEDLIEEEDAIPAYMEFFLLQDAAQLEDSDHTISYHVITPSDPHGIAEDASMWQPEAGTWEIETNGDLASTHWVEEGQIVRSDWQGVVSRPVSPDEAVRTLKGIIDDDELSSLLAHETAGD
ncbi:hypothetical protein [Ancrocorticia populi]|uniref:hypothetical protein n=1 Tax=Ancrocorticia populi TaxID=2175228 RepID=UPI002352C59D|nr:hypothetical protein [Ancrocorticia populi]